MCVHHATQLVSAIPAKEEKERNACSTIARNALGHEDPAAFVVCRSSYRKTRVDSQAAHTSWPFGLIIATPQVRPGNLSSPVPDPVLLRLLAV